VAVAGLLALLGRAPSEPEPATSAGARPGQTPLPPRFPLPRPSPGAVTDPPSRAEVEAARVRADRHPEVRDAGAAALVEKGLECPSRSRKVQTLGEPGGGVGCEVQIADAGRIPIGRWVYSREDGLFEVGEYENGVREGVWTTYFPDGSQAMEGEFAADQRHGVWRHWSEDGSLMIERGYDHGRQHGRSLYWPPGKPAEVEVWVQGDRVYPGPVEPPPPETR
jgi:hypothetical protein